MEAKERSHHHRHRHRSQQQSSKAPTRQSVRQPFEFPVVPQANDGKDDLVLGWLNNLGDRRSGACGTDAHVLNLDNSKSRSRRHTQSPPEHWAPHGLSLPITFHHSVSTARPRSHAGRRISRSGSLQDSSNIGASPRRDPIRLGSDLAQDHGQTLISNGGYPDTHQKRKGPVPYDASEPSVLSAPDETFEKRTRHKTRRDRYDVCKHDDGGKDRRMKGTRSPRERKRRKREHLPSVREVMGNFQSDSILHERITVRITSQAMFELG